MLKQIQLTKNLLLGVLCVSWRALVLTLFLIGVARVDAMLRADIHFLLADAEMPGVYQGRSRRSLMHGERMVRRLEAYLSDYPKAPGRIGHRSGE